MENVGKYIVFWYLKIQHYLKKFYITQTITLLGDIRIELYFIFGFLFFHTSFLQKTKSENTYEIRINNINAEIVNSNQSVIENIINNIRRNF